MNQSVYLIEAQDNETHEKNIYNTKQRCDIY